MVNSSCLKFLTYTLFQEKHLQALFSLQLCLEIVFILYIFINIFPDVCETSFKIKEVIESKINLYKNGKATNIKEYLGYIPYAEGHNAFHQSKCD